MVAVGHRSTVQVHAGAGGSCGAITTEVRRVETHIDLSRDGQREVEGSAPSGRLGGGLVRTRGWVGRVVRRARDGEGRSRQTLRAHLGEPTRPTETSRTPLVPGDPALPRLALSARLHEHELAALADTAMDLPVRADEARDGVRTATEGDDQRDERDPRRGRRMKASQHCESLRSARADAWRANLIAADARCQASLYVRSRIFSASWRSYAA